MSKTALRLLREAREHHVVAMHHQANSSIALARGENDESVRQVETAWKASNKFITAMSRLEEKLAQ